MNNFYPTICRKLLLGVVLTASLHPATFAQNPDPAGHSIASNPPRRNQVNAKKTKSLIDALSQISSFYKVGFNYDSDKLEGKSSPEAATLNLSGKAQKVE